MNILAIDTSSKNASVAILEDNKTLTTLNNIEEKTHSQKLMPMIDQAFAKTNLSLNEIGLISCCLGPGSFTGVRIGIATAKAFADAKNISVVGVTSLEGLAYNIVDNGIICSIIDAKNGNVFYGIFEHKDNCYTPLLPINFDSIQNMLELLKQFTISNKIYFVGDASNIYKNIIQDFNFPNISFATDNQSLASSISIAKAGYNKYKNGNYGDSSTLIPVYLRKSQAEITLEKNKV